MNLIATYNTVGLILVLFTAAVIDAREIAPAGPGETCGFDGNGDMYGLGIRLGVYIQAFATTLSGAYRQESSRGASFANGFFQFAMFVALVYMTVINRELEVVEAAIIILFTFCSVSIANPEDKEALKKPEGYRLRDIRKFLRHSFVPFGKMLTELALNLYWTWFWFIGIERQKLSPCTGYGFFFSKVSLFGWFRTLATVVTVSMVVWDVFVIVRVLDSKPPLPSLITEITEYDANATKKSIVCMRDFAGLVISLAIIGFYVLSVESMILWNNIRNVNVILGSVGQMIPFLVGMGSFIAVILEWNVKPECNRCKKDIMQDGNPRNGSSNERGEEKVTDEEKSGVTSKQEEITLAPKKGG
ncbi:hypothetical protein BZA77DRAFT_346480 [Pyronema omphalodes]|nr:hypothetical protein BZA77DRAFT_346480 [Pyronema omphalodes]